MSVVYHYNPDLLSDDDLREQFVVRTPTRDALLAALRSEAPGHHLVIAPRGMGKTTLLRRLHLAVREDPALAARWLPLAFPEEQYNVSSLADFWANCADALADTLERSGREADARALDQQVDALDRADAAAGLELLVDATRREGRGLVLLVDNLDIVLGRLDDRQQWELRSVLGGHLPLVLIAASADLQAETTQYGKPFYEFLQVHPLGPLSLEEMQRLLTTLAQRAGGDHPARLASVPAGRIHALHALTGGNPRTAGLLFEVFAADPTNDAEGVVNALLDRVTPLYKDRFESLPDQLQQVLDAVALAWNPASAADIAERVGLPVNHVSAALARLMQLAVVETVRLPHTKRAGFQVAERFFNIWYLMRASRRLRRRLGHLVRFMEAIWGLDERQAFARRLFDVRGSLETSLAVAQTAGLHADSAARALVARRLREIDGDATRLAERLAELVEPGENGQVVRDVHAREAMIRETRQDVFAAEVDWGAVGVTREEFWGLFAGMPNPWAVKRQVAREVRENARTAAPVVAELVGMQRKWLASNELLQGAHSTRCVDTALADGTLDDMEDVRGADVAFALGNPWPTIYVARMNGRCADIATRVLDLAWKEMRRERDPAAARLLTAVHGERGEQARSFAAYAANVQYTPGTPRGNVVNAWIYGREPEEAARVLADMPITTSEELAAFVEACLTLAAADEIPRVRTVLEARGVLDAFAPFLDALRVHEAGDRSLLDGLAPELRAAAVEVLDSIARRSEHLARTRPAPPSPLPDPGPASSAPKRRKRRDA